MSKLQEKKHIGGAEASGGKLRALTRADFLKIAGGAGVASAVGLRPQSAHAQSRAPLNTPTICCVGDTQNTIFLRVTAGPSGAPAGFSIQWVKKSDFPALVCAQKQPSAPGTSCHVNTNDCVLPPGLGSDPNWPPSDGLEICKASFSGVPGCSIYNLAPNACVTVEIGNLNDAECGVGLSNCGAGELQCGTEYVFRAFAHNEPGRNGRGRSDFTYNLCCSTENCTQGSCVHGQGYWKTHGPAGCNPSGGANLWPVTSLTIGGTTYSDTDLCINLNLSGGGNAVRILSHQLIAALLNVANGATPPPNCDIAAASALLNGLNINVALVHPSTALGQQMTAAAACLGLYNNGDGGVAHCP